MPPDVLVSFNGSSTLTSANTHPQPNFCFFTQPNDTASQKSPWIPTILSTQLAQLMQNATWIMGRSALTTSTRVPRRLCYNRADITLSSVIGCAAAFLVIVIALGGAICRWVVRFVFCISANHISVEVGAICR